MAAIVGPVQFAFGRLVVGESTRRVGGRSVRQINRVDFDVFNLFLTAVDGVAHEGQFLAVGRNNEILNTQRRGGDDARPRSVGCLFLRFGFHLLWGGRVAVDRACQVESIDCVSTLGGSILHHIFPFFLVGVLLLLVPGIAGGEIDGARVSGPRKIVDVFFSPSDWESLATAGRNQVDLAGVAAFFFALGGSLVVIIAVGIRI